MVEETNHQDTYFSWFCKWKPGCYHYNLVLYLYFLVQVEIVAQNAVPNNGTKFTKTSCGGTL